MAHLVRQQKTYYVDAHGKRVPKGAPKAKKVREKSAKWYGVGIPGLPPKKRVPLDTDKRVAERMLADLIERGERGIVGMPARDEAARSMAPLVKEFREAVSRRAEDGHTQTVIAHVEKVLDGCRIATLADLNASDVAPRVKRFVWALIDGDEKLTSATAAYHGKHVRSFTRWLWRKRKLLTHDPLAGMNLPSQEATKKRRAMAAEELAALLGAAENSTRAFHELTGPDRALLCLLAVATGYRAGELAKLTPVHFDLDAEPPVVRLKGKHTKNKKTAEQPLPPIVAARLRGYLAGRAADKPVWPGTWSKRSAVMLKADLDEAQLPAVVDEEHNLFHSLRHSFTTLLAQVASVKVTQELARHSTPVLTIGRYGHTNMKEKADAVTRLPLPGAGHDQDILAALPRAELELFAATLAGLLAAIFADPVTPLVTPRITPNSATGGDASGLSETLERRKRRPKRKTNS